MTDKAAFSVNTADILNRYSEDSGKALQIIHSAETILKVIGRNDALHILQEEILSPFNVYANNFVSEHDGKKINTVELAEIHKNDAVIGFIDERTVSPDKIPEISLSEPQKTWSTPVDPFPRAFPKSFHVKLR